MWTEDQDSLTPDPEAEWPGELPGEDQDWVEFWDSVTHSDYHEHLLNVLDIHGLRKPENRFRKPYSRVA